MLWNNVTLTADTRSQGGLKNVTVLLRTSDLNTSKNMNATLF